MARLTFVEKLSVLFNLTKSSKLYLVILLAVIALGLILLTSNRKSAKPVKFFYVLIYMILIGIVLYVYKDNLSNMMDYMMNNLFIIIYFPNLAIYLAAILTSNVICLVTVFSKKMPKIIKKINILMYCVISYILIIILNIINENNLDVFNQSSVYGNTTAQALIELTSTIFIAWICFLIIYKIIKPYFFKEKVPTKVIVKKVVKKPANYKPIEAPYQVKAVNNTIKVEKEPKENTAKYDDLLTIDDYKLLLNILKEQKEKERQEKERQERIDKEQAKYRELQELYRSVQ
ncbi:unknown [Mycoplasma sp. CAG:877]|nr:unknown [Mycoplasma sp. CAG:877]